MLSAPSQTGSVSGKWRPRSPSPTRPSTASATAWADGVGVAVAAQPARPFDLDAAEDQRAVRVLGEGVDVDPLADAHAQRPPPRRSRRSAAPRSSGVGDLEVARLAGHRPARCRRAPRRSTASSVAPAPACSWARRSDPARNACGVWTATSRAAVQRGRDVAGAVHRLDRVTRREAGHGSVGPAGGHGGDHGIEQARPTPAAGPRRAPRPPRRRRAPRPARQRTESARVAPPATTTSAPWESGTSSMSSGSTRTTPADEGRHACDGPLEHGAAAEGGELLAVARSAGPRHRPRRSTTPHRATVRPGRAIRAARRSDALRPSPRPR